MAASRGVILLLVLVQIPNGIQHRFDSTSMKAYKERARAMFTHAYDGYIKHAYPYDELRPITCDGHDTWGSFSLTLIDALDTLIIMGNSTEFRRVANLLINKMNFDIDINASVFETNIRVVGGLLSAHLFSKRAGMTLEPGWPCSGSLLRMAETVARKILPAFDTPTGMPYGTVNLRHGVPEGETTVTCTAGVGTFLIEFGTLSRLTGDPIFEKVAIRALRSLWRSRSNLGLVGNHIDIITGKWTALDAGIGGGIDSYFEYLVKGTIMFNIPELLSMFHEFAKTLEKHVKRDDWYLWAHMTKGSITLPVFTSLDAYWPGIQSMLGNIDEAMKTIHNFHQVWKQYGFVPEYYNIPKADVHQGREGYPLRPELVESAMYLYQATKDPYLLEIGVDMLEAIEHSTWTKCGYATVKDVQSHLLENRMESFFLAETTKYLYLLFDTDNFMHNTGNTGTIIQTSNGECVIDTGAYIFNTEAHPIDMAAVHCCSAQKKEDDKVIQAMHDSIDLLALMGITDFLEEDVKDRSDDKNDDVDASFVIKDFAIKYRDNEDLIMEKDLSDADGGDIMFDDVMDDGGASGGEVGIAPDGDNESDRDGYAIKASQMPKEHFNETETGNVDISKNERNVNKQTNNEVKVATVEIPSAKILSKADGIQRDSAEKDSEQDQLPTKKHTQPDVLQPLSATYTKAKKSQTNLGRLLSPQIEKIFGILLGDSSDKVSKNKPSAKHLYRSLKNYSLNYTVEPDKLTCKAQSYHMRLSTMGEMFINDVS